MMKMMDNGSSTENRVTCGDGETCNVVAFAFPRAVCMAVVTGVVEAFMPVVQTTGGSHTAGESPYHFAIVIAVAQ